MVGGSQARATVSLGSGVETEVLHLLWQDVLSKSGQLLLERADDRATVATSCTMVTSRHAVSEVRLKELTYMGALIALLLIHSIPPEPFNPVVLQYFIYNCDFRSLTRELVAEWHPELRRLLEEWLHVGSQGDLRPFASHIVTYLDRQVSTCTPLFKHHLLNVFLARYPRNPGRSISSRSGI